MRYANIKQDDKVQPMPINPDRLKSRLENKALHYLGRYASSEANLRQILKRFAMRKCRPAETPADADDDDADADTDAFRQILETEIDALITRYRALGYVDDRGFALGRARAMRARGASTRRIIQTLKAKGIDAEIASEIMADGLEANTNTETPSAETLSPETTAARIYAQRRRLGQYASPTSQAKPNWKDRHLASMMRAGFNYATAKSALFDAD